MASGASQELTPCIAPKSASGFPVTRCDKDLERRTDSKSASAALGRSPVEQEDAGVFGLMLRLHMDRDARARDRFP